MQINRWLYAIAGVIVMLVAGLIYAWSVFRTPIAAEFGWTASQLSLNFSLCMAMFCLGGLFAGILSKKIPYRIIVLAAAVLILVGFLLTSRIQSLGLLYFGYGFLSGLAIGLVYNAVLSTILKWFPDKPGLISGILLMGFGFSAMLVAPIFTRMSQGMGWRDTFVVLGIVAAVVFVLASFFMKAPGPDYKFPEPKKKKAAAAIEEADVPPAKMIMKVVFWCFFIWGILLCSCGLAVNSQAYPLAEGVFLGSSMADSMTATAMAGMLSVIVSLFSVFNGVGRVMFGAIFDRKGGTVTMFAVTICFIAAGVIMAAALATGSFGLVTFGLIFMGLSYGGLPTMSSAFTRKTFGSKNYPVNLPIVNLNLLIASFIGPTVAARMFDTAGSYLGPMLCVIAFAIVALICAVLLRKRA